MLAIGRRPRVYLSRVPTDMRCSFEGLSARARSVIQQDPLSGHLFVFLNRQRDYIKVLYWDDGGYCIWSKRLERGTFELPVSEAAHVEIDANKLLLMIEGISLESVKKRKRFMLKNAD
jgi:transposase